MTFVRRHPGPSIAALALFISVLVAIFSMWSRAEAAPLRERVIVIETLLPEIRDDVKAIREDVKEMKRLQSRDADAYREAR